MHRVSVSHGMIDSRFVSICPKTLLGEELEYGSRLEFLFISDSSVDTRYVLVSSVPFQIVRSSSTFGIIQFIDLRILGYYEFQDKSVFCVKHIMEYQLDMDGYTDDSFDDSSSKFLVIYKERSAFEQLKTVRSRLQVICEDENEPLVSVYSSPDIGNLMSVAVQRFPVDLETFAGACTGYNVIVFRVHTLTGSIMSFLAELTLLKEDLNRRGAVSPVVLCYVGNIENLNLAVTRIYAPYTWGCNVEQQYKHFLSACILSKNNGILLKVLGASSF